MEKVTLTSAMNAVHEIVLRFIFLTLHSSSPPERRCGRKMQLESCDAEKFSEFEVLELKTLKFEVT